MRYIKVLCLVVLIFIGLIFFMQNQAPLSQEMKLTLNLFFVPAVSSMPLPFYFVVACSFLVGGVLATLFFWWNKLTMSTRILTNTWKIRRLEKDLASTREALELQTQKEAMLIEMQKAKDDAQALEAASVTMTKQG